jgi:hypothetical protein
MCSVLNCAVRLDSYPWSQYLSAGLGTHYLLAFPSSSLDTREGLRSTQDRRHPCKSNHTHLEGALPERRRCVSVTYFGTSVSWLPRKARPSKCGVVIAVHLSTTRLLSASDSGWCLFGDITGRNLCRSLASKPKTSTIPCLQAATSKGESFPGVAPLLI